MATLFLFLTIVSVAALLFYGVVWAKIISFAMNEPALFELAFKPSLHIFFVPLCAAGWLIARLFA